MIACQGMALIKNKTANNGEKRYAGSARNQLRPMGHDHLRRAENDAGVLYPVIA
jgi:hypothetical protein